MNPEFDNLVGSRYAARYATNSTLAPGRMVFHVLNRANDREEMIEIAQCRRAVKNGMSPIGRDGPKGAGHKLD